MGPSAAARALTEVFENLKSALSDAGTKRRENGAQRAGQRRAGSTREPSLLGFRRELHASPVRDVSPVGACHEWYARGRIGVSSATQPNHDRNEGG
jgi:hypothetical protein